MNKKGIVQDIGAYIIALFLMAMVIIILAYTTAQINTAWQGNNGIPDFSKNMFNTYANRFANTYDNFYVILVIGYLIVTLIIAFALRSNPAFAWFAFIIMIILGVVSVNFSNVFFDLTTSPTIAPVAEDFTKLNFLGQRLPHIVAIFGIIFIIVLYAKANTGETPV